MSKRDTYAGGSTAHYLLLGSTLFLLLLGLVMIYSASSVSDLVTAGDSAHHLKRQLMWIAIGLVLLVLVRRFDYRRLKTLAWPFYLISLAGLVAVLAVGVTGGEPSDGSHWAPTQSSRPSTRNLRASW